MRAFEMILWLLVSGGVVRLLFRSRPSRREALLWAAASASAALVHLTAEGVRFHMVPTYALLLALLVSWVRLAGHAAPRGRWARLAGAAAALPAVALGLALPTLFPVYAYPAPDGPYGVGTAEYVVDHGRSGRDLVIQAWYPVAPGTRGQTAGLSRRPDLLAGALGSLTGLPRLLFDHLRLVHTHALRDVPVAPDRRRFPVVLFSHGPISANRSQSVFQMEALASHGFIAVAIDHTGYASTTVFPDGHAVGVSPGVAWPVAVDERSRALVKTWVADVRAVIDRLEALDAGDAGGVLAGRLDLSRVGYLGASFGGSVVVQALVEEPRLKAGVAEDGKPYFFDEALEHLHRPLMYLQSAMPYLRASDAQLAAWGTTPAAFKLAEQDHYQRLMQLFAAARGPIYDVQIRRTNHLTFSDLPLMIHLPSLDLMDAGRAHRIVNDYTIAFFKRHLDGAPAPLIDGDHPAPVPEVTVASRNVLGPLALTPE